MKEYATRAKKSARLAPHLTSALSASMGHTNSMTVSAPISLASLINLEQSSLNSLASTAMPIV